MPTTRMRDVPGLHTDPASACASLQQRWVERYESIAYGPTPAVQGADRGYHAMQCLDRLCCGAMPGTERGYAAIGAVAVWDREGAGSWGPRGIVLRYPVSGTGIAVLTWKSSTETGYTATQYCAELPYEMSGTDLGSAATRPLQSGRGGGQVDRYQPTGLLCDVREQSLTGVSSEHSHVGAKEGGQKQKSRPPHVLSFA
eukprot:1814488-Rhodomonas_salina.1